MDQKNDRKPTDQPAPAESPSPRALRKRFHIEKLEERIAPDKGGNPHNSHGSGNSSASSGFSGMVSVY